MQPSAREEFALKVSAAQWEREIPKHLAKATHGLKQRPTPKIHTQPYAGYNTEAAYL